MKLSCPVNVSPVTDLHLPSNGLSSHVGLLSMPSVSSILSVQFLLVKLCVSQRLSERHLCAGYRCSIANFIAFSIVCAALFANPTIDQSQPTRNGETFDFILHIRIIVPHVCGAQQHPPSLLNQSSTKLINNHHRVRRHLFPRIFLSATSPRRIHYKNCGRGLQTRYLVSRFFLFPFRYRPGIIGRSVPDSRFKFPARTKMHGKPANDDSPWMDL